MGFQFAETMAGTIEWDSEPGKRHPFRFEVTATAASTRAHLASGKAALRGRLFAPPRATGVPTEGEITIRLFGDKIIRYELAFAGDDGTAYEMRGEKTIRWLAPRASFTSLPTAIFDVSGGGERHVATCETRFDLRTLWPFLRSFKLA
ncbi:MAG: hypothetical protein NT062_02055 [Proteobacteria bacterium]|nr:hypothetical protein [Pseudomonadota bacterium]